MTQTTLVRARGNYYAYSFTTGATPIVPKVRKTDNDILAECMQLAKEDKHEEAYALLERYFPSRK